MGSGPLEQHHDRGEQPCTPGELTDGAQPLMLPPFSISRSVPDMHRRLFLGLAGASLAAGLSREARSQAQGWPTKPVKLILPYAPGGATDLIGRPWADKLSQVFGQQFVIENRGGAGGMIGTEAAAKAAPDGYTFLLTPNATLTVLPNMRK